MTSALDLAAKSSGLFIGGKWEDSPVKMPVRDKYSQGELSQIACATSDHVDRVLQAADAYVSGEGVPVYERSKVLDKMAEELAARRDELVDAIVLDTGFTRKDAAGEITRAMENIRLSAEETRRITGEMVPIASAPGQAGRMAFTVHQPYGIVAAITPFNSPLNTVLHKVGPAFGAGNAVILKPANQTPLTAILLAEAFAAAGAPAGSFNLLCAPNEESERLVKDPRVRYIAFTGSTSVGKRLQEIAGLRKTQMELGSISATIVCRDANIEKAVAKIVPATFRKAGQVCTSVQVLLLHEEIYSQAKDLLLNKVKALVIGDPNSDETDVGPLISLEAAERVAAWIKEAQDAGADLLCGGDVEGAVIQPAILENVPRYVKLDCTEVFGPVVSLVPFSSFDEAIGRANDTPYGLATGIFTGNLDEVLTAVRKLDVGNIHINETSSSRVDLMPYGGIKDSGFGKEGPPYAIYEMMEEKLVTLASSM